MSPLISQAQCRAARGLLDWTQEELAELAGLSRSTVRDFESGRHELNRLSAVQVLAAFENAGLLFIPPASALGEGVRFRALSGSG